MKGIGESVAGSNQCPIAELRRESELKGVTSWPRSPTPPITLGKSRRRRIPKEVKWRLDPEDPMPHPLRRLRTRKGQLPLEGVTSAEKEKSLQAQRVNPTTGSHSIILAMCNS